MKKTILCAVIAILIAPLTMKGQSYSDLWKQAEKAGQDDLPKSERKVLAKIVKKAEKEKVYGHLLKALLTDARMAAMLSPDSLAPAVERLKQREQQSADQPLRAVYQAVLSRIYADNPSLDDHALKLSKSYAEKAVSHPKELAATKTTGYVPFVKEDVDSRLFDDDLLSLIGHETKQYRPMYHYYMTTTNRRAQLLSALRVLEQDEPEGSMRLKDCDYIRRLDSLANAYADLPECGEVAISRYEFMDGQTDATAEQKVAYIDEALRRWGSWQRMNMLRNARRDLTALQFNATLEHSLWIPNREQRLWLGNLRGISELTINIYKVKADGDISLDADSKEDFKKLKPLLTPMPELTLKRTYSGKKDYELSNDTLQMAGMPVGVYMMEVETKPQTKVARTLFFISDVRVLMEALPNDHDNQLRYVVVNGTTGQPLAGAQLRLWRRYGYGKDKVLATLTADSKGEAVYQCQNQERPNYALATTDADRACPPLIAMGHFNYYANDRTLERTAIYTDRAIYRPGQTVHVAAICYEKRKGYEHEVKAGKHVTVSLRDANYKTVAEKKLITDEFGTVSTDFPLPASGLTGRFTVQVGNQTQAFRVEEYKRPTFQVEFPKVEQDYKDGDTLTVKATARAYSGVPVQGARVKYTVERRMAFWWFNYYRYWQSGYFGYGEQNQEVYSGETTTADDGSFEVLMPMVLPQSLHPQFYNFVVVADVTDQGGETHQGQLSLPLGNRKNALTADLPEKILAEEMPQLKLHVMNAAGNDVSATIRYQIDGGKWTKVQTNTPIVLPRLKSGKHTLKAEFEGEKLEREFVVFSLNDKRPVIETDNWFYVSAQQFPIDGKPVTLQVGASGDVHIIYTMVAGNDIIEQGAVDCSNELINRKLVYKPEYGNGLTLSYAWVREGKTYTHHVQIQRPLPDKQLKLKWETFRDRLTPGQQEEWTLKIEAPENPGAVDEAQTSDTAKAGARFQLMATLYDKSLDQILGQNGQHQWSLEPQNWLPMASLHWSFLDRGMAGCHGYKHEGQLSVRELRFSHFDHDCFPVFSLHRRYLTRNVMKAGMVVQEEGMVLHEVAVASQKAVVAFDAAGNDEAMGSRFAAPETADEDGTETQEAETQQPEMQMRENLQETAFFYPQLLADSTGLVSLKFTLPESLTTWRFMGIAHSKNMMHGYIDGEAVAKKDVMVQPNMPRFLRMGDEGTISARIFNTTDKTVSTTAQLKLLEPESNGVVFEEQVICLLEANNTASISFRIPQEKLQGHSLLVCRVSAIGDTFSDGEQHYLPVLPNRERVTITVPFTQTQPGTKTINLEALFPKAGVNSQPSPLTSDLSPLTSDLSPLTSDLSPLTSDLSPLTSDLSPLTSKLTIEYTNNPAWLMIQALPSVAHPYDNCAICQAAAYYANSIGQHILKQNPQAKHVFEMWKREDASLLTLHSSLEKNEELKDLVLSETPWVMDADRESEQKQSLGDFFDENLMQSRLSNAVENLKKLQNADGSWSWWPEMPGSFCMTVEISEMLVRLGQMTNKSQISTLNPQLDKAFKFMDKEILELVAEMKKEEKKGVKQTFPTFKALQYLYLSTLDGRTPSAKVKEAQAYLKKLLKKDVKNQTIYEKALSAIILSAPLYVKSLKEYTVYREDMGRYYDTSRAGYSWRDYRIPTQVAAIEAIQRLTPRDTATIDEMRRWLLQEKRTQAWDTPINSADAIYAFLNGNKQALAPQAKTRLSIDGQPLETSEATAGVGYVKTAMPAEGKKEFKAEKTSTGTSWGAVYAQFMQNTNDIQDQGSEISVKREIITDHSPLTSHLSTLTGPLKVGQRIKVRLTIEAQRDLDFVEVVDRRAACMEPVNQLSGYHWGYYCAPKDNATHYFFDMLRKGKHVIETEYYIDRAGQYETGTCTAGCAYAPEFRATTHSITLKIED